MQELSRMAQHDTVVEPFNFLFVVEKDVLFLTARMTLARADDPTILISGLIDHLYKAGNDRIVGRSKLLNSHDVELSHDVHQVRHQVGIVEFVRAEDLDVERADRNDGI